MTVTRDRDSESFEELIPITAAWEQLVVVVVAAAAVGVSAAAFAELCDELFVAVVVVE